MNKFIGYVFFLFLWASGWLLFGISSVKSQSSSSVVLSVQLEYPITAEQCLKIGGHCYEPDAMGNRRACKHCGHSQIWNTQLRTYWIDEPDKTKK